MFRELDQAWDTVGGDYLDELELSIDALLVSNAVQKNSPTEELNIKINTNGG